ESGARLIVIDTLRDGDLIEIGAAVADLPLITGGSGIALGLPENFRMRGEIGTSGMSWAGVGGPCVALSGSCSKTTRAQIVCHAKSHPTLEIVADAVMGGELTPGAAAAWAKKHADGVPLIYSSTDAKTVSQAQATYGKQEIADQIEGFFAATARLLRDAGYSRIISAGGETSGAVVAALGADALEIGPEIDPGVPAVKVVGAELALALKSGNFGREDFFAHAAEVLKAP
ncbi:MAG: four-carbon acid sugar kinase family protein, partial [Rhodobacteraceae bacterium]|nr:four-carbon acid sugar kinase family protein [Paracoccaceae bacterium]